MAFLEGKEIHEAYLAASEEADQWRADYPQYERLMDNGLLENLDPNLPEVNDGSLAASLFKLAKRVIKKKLSGRATALGGSHQWITELANIRWKEHILPNANSMSTPRRKWKDAVRKAAGYGSQPIITLLVDHDGTTGSDFIVPYCQDVKLEAGKVSDMDSDIIFWDVYYSKLQLKNMIEEAKEDTKNPDGDGYNKWDVPLLEEIYKSCEEEERSGTQEARERMEKGIIQSGVHFYVAFQRGVDAPFEMRHAKHEDKPVRSWSNPDPTGDVPVHYLYCYQDFINPYGIGIVKLAGGTQNVLDYMRQADILATQLGLRPPKLIHGDEDSVDESSMVYAQDANWYVGNTKVERLEMSTQVYEQLPGRMSMYQTSLQKMLPMGETGIPAGQAGDPQVSKTPAGVKLQAANLSIDDEDFAENVDEVYAMVAQSMINIEFASLQGSDMMTLTDNERELMIKAGCPWPTDEMGNFVGNDLDVEWDKARAKFKFLIDPDADKTQDDAKALEGLLKVAELRRTDPEFDAKLAENGKRLNMGELYSEIIALSSENKEIIEDISPEEQQTMQQQQEMAMAGGADPMMGQPGMEQPPTDQAGPDPMEEEQAAANVQAVMEQYNVPVNIAAAMLEAERQGFEPEEVVAALQRNMAPMNGAPNA